MANRLKEETSPYLQQHAHNPVDWYPWGAEALARAKEKDRPIFLSIGYSACHWCHVMERESFEDPEIARYLNDHFVPVKVDREERPDLDNIYMEALQVMTGQGGWPMSVFLTPELEPFYAGTYFPPRAKWGRPGFHEILEQLHEVYNDDPEKVARVGEQVRERLESMARTDRREGALSLDPVGAAATALDRAFDEGHGGFGGAPKFPPSMQLRLLLHVWADPEREEAQRTRALDMVERTLVHMASGGMYDHIGGGFHRYSVDARWLVPHFEKMLYDNALLLQAYTEAFQATGRPFYERIVGETVDYVLREMVLEHDEELKPFYATQDADSEGEEGKFFVWSPDELVEVLGEERAARAAEFWGITEAGNFEGASIPNRLHAVEGDWTSAFERLPNGVQELRALLFQAREGRVHPATDTKILASWNGLMIGALARAGAVFGESEWIDAAACAARFVLEEMRDPEHTGAHVRLMRTYKDGRARFPGYLDDYAFMACGLLDLFEATADLDWLRQAENLVDTMIALFADDADEGSGGFFYTAEHHEHLIVRQKESYDGATPASNSRAIEALLRLSVLRDRPELRDRAEQALEAFFPQMKAQPRSLTEMLQSLDFHLRGPRELVLRTPEGEESLARKVWQEYVPNAVLLDVPTGAFTEWIEAVPLIEGKAVVEGKPTLYVCRQGACERPVHEVDLAL